MYCAWADRIATNAAANEVGRDCLRQSDHSGFCSSIDKTAGRCFYTGSGRRHINDAPLSSVQHGWQKSTAGSIHGLDIQIEREIPIFFFTIENAAVMNIARAVEQDIDGSHFAGKISDFF